MTEELYQKIIELLKEEEKKAKELKSDVKTTIINGKEISTVTDSVTGEKKIFDNSYSNESIESQMEQVQKEHKQFQNLLDDNTLGVIQFMEKNIKITPETQESNEIKSDNLNEEEQTITKVVKTFEMDIGHPVQIDLSGKIIYDGENIYTIEKRDGEYQIISQETKEKQEDNKGPQLVMKKNNIDKAA